MIKKEKAKSEGTEIVTSPSKGGFTSAQLQLLKRTIAKDATDDEFKIFAMACNRYGLDPFTNQIHFVKRGKDGNGQMTIQTGIDGYRAIAERSGQLAGISDVKYDEESEKRNAPHPDKASVCVYRFVNGEKVHFTASARWKEYAPTGKQAFMWNKMPYLMLGKCAEALALRKAFPNDLSGLYTNEELMQADNTTTIEKPSYVAPKPQEKKKAYYEYKDPQTGEMEIGLEEEKLPNGNDLFGDEEDTGETYNDHLTDLKK